MLCVLTTAVVGAFSISESLGLGLGGAEPVGVADWFDLLANLVVVIVTPLAAWFAKRYIDDGTARVTAREALYDAARAAVAETYETYVRAMKAGRADGTLSDAERREAMRLAVERAKQIARVRGVDLARTYGEDVIRGVVQAAVAAARRPRAATA